jgi:hypothetical protein
MSFQSPDGAFNVIATALAHTATALPLNVPAGDGVFKLSG